MSASSQAIIVAIAATAATTLLFAAISFYFFQKFAFDRYRHRHKVAASLLREAGTNPEDMKKVGGNMKGLLVEENTIDILYMMETEGRQFKTRFPNRRYNPSYEDDEEKRIDIMVQRSNIKPRVVTAPLLCKSPGPELIYHESQVASVSQASSLPYSVSAPNQDLPQLPQHPPPLPSPPQTSPMILEKKNLPLSSLPPLPPPPPPPPRKEVPKAPPLPSSPIMNREDAVSPPMASGFKASSKQPLPPKGKANIENTAEAMAEECSRGNGAGQTRLKPLYWDKVVANVDHSTVWDRINDGSFRFDSDLMETLFGYSTNNQTHERNRCLSTSAKSNSNTPPQVVILDPRKSQNTAIVLRSLAISRKGILDALLNGHGLSAETLERLTKIAPTKEDEAKIVQFSGSPDKLADAESFLHYLLTAVPSAFIRLKALLPRSTYDCEVIQLKEHLETLEMCCNEVKTSGVLLKFLEAILKAGNRTSAGTSRGNAYGFNINSLKKLCDVKSTDGKTSLLHFIVDQVAQSEARQQAINQKHNLNRSIGEISNTTEPYSDSLAQHETEKEYLKLGLPVLGTVRDELSEVKKAASIEHQNFSSMHSILNAYVTEIQQIVTCCGNCERGGFIKVMKRFEAECEEELKVVREEQTRIMELVNETNEYFPTGGSKDNMSNPFQLFVTVKEFVDMVDEVCIELRRKLEKNNAGGEAVSTPPLSPLKRAPLRLPNLDLYSQPIR